MTTHLLRRVLWAGPVLLVATTCAFLALRLIPGDPVSLMLAGRPASEEIRQNLRQKLGLDRPLMAQYLHFLGRAVQGDFGESYLTRQPVTRVIGEQLPASLQLAAGGLLIGLAGGIVLGLIGGLRPGGVIDGLVMILALVGVSLPGFWTAMLLIYVFGLRLGWVPIVGTGLRSLILPSVVLGSFAIGNLARLVRSSVLEVKGEDYVRTARAKGLPEAAVVLRHALRNALIPIVTMVGLQLGLFVSGAVITETVFARQGVGSLLVDAILNKDYPVVQAVIVLTTGAYVLANILVDLTYTVVDPRLRHG